MAYKFREKMSLELNRARCQTHKLPLEGGRCIYMINATTISGYSAPAAAAAAAAEDDCTASV